MSRSIVKAGDCATGDEILQMAWQGDVEGIESGVLYQRAGSAVGRANAAFGGRRHYFRRVLTARQVEALTIIIEHRSETGMSPTLEEISHGMGMKMRTGAACHVERLIQKGFLGRKDGKTRTLVPLRGVDGRPLVDWKARALAAEAEVARLRALLSERAAA